MTNTKDYRLERYSGHKGLDRLFDEWAELTKQLQHPNPSHFPHWYKAFLRRPDAQKVHAEFIAIYAGDALAAVFPVGLERTGRFNLIQLSIPMNIDINSVPDVVVAANQDHRELFRFFLRESKAIRGLNWHILFVRKTLADSNISKCITSVRRFTTTQGFVGHCCYFDVGSRDEGPLQLPKKVRARIRNAKNRLQSAGVSDFEVVVDSSAVMEAFSEFAELETSGWKAHSDHGKPDYNHGQAIALNESKYGFYRDVMSAFACLGRAEMYRLNLDGRPIAVLMAVMLRGNCYLLRTAYEDSHAHLSPGVLLFDFVLQQNQKKPDVATVTLFSDFKWMDSWRPLRQDYVSYHCFNSTFLSLSFGTARRIKGLLRSVYRRILSSAS